MIESFSIIKEQLEAISELIRQQLYNSSLSKEMSGLLDHIRGVGGKMLRPGLVLLSGLSCGELVDEHIKVAGVFEMIHDATLLHDDVIDESQKRRGVDTINHLHGNESAVLLGDFLLSKVFSLSAELNPHTAKIIAGAAAATCQGELDQNIQKSNWQIDEQEYIGIVSNKTASLFRCCCLLGAALAGADGEESEAFAEFGTNFGIAFQIADDVRDITRDQKQEGKSTGLDIEGAKPTLPVIYLLANTEDMAKQELLELLNAGLEQREKIKAVLEVNGAIEYSREKVHEYIDKAITEIADIPESEAKASLIKTAEFVADSCR